MPSLPSLSPSISPIPDLDSLSSSPQPPLKNTFLCSSSITKNEEILPNNESSANTTLSDPCSTHLEPISSPPVPVQSSPPSTNLHSTKKNTSNTPQSFNPSLNSCHVVSSPSPTPSSSSSSSSPSRPTSTSAIRVKRHRLVEVNTSSSVPSSSSQKHIESQKSIKEPSNPGKFFSRIPYPKHLACPTSISSTTSPHSSPYPSIISRDPLFLLNEEENEEKEDDDDDDDEKDNQFSSPMLPPLSPITTGFSSPPSLDTSFSSNLSDFSNVHSDLEDLEEDALIKALNQKLPSSALDMFVSLKQKESNVRNPTSPSHSPPHTLSSPPRASPSPYPTNALPLGSSPIHSPKSNPHSHIHSPLSPLSIMGVPQLNHLAKVYGVLFDVHCLHLNPVALYTVPSVNGGWLSLSTLSDYQSGIQFKLPSGLGACTCFIPLRQPQRQRSELNTLRILCPQQETVPLQCTAKTIDTLMTQPCHVVFTLEPKQKLVSGLKTSFHKHSKTMLVKTESQLKLLPLLKAKGFQYRCEVPFFIENSKFLGYLDVTLKLLPILRVNEEQEGDEVEKVSSLGTVFATTKDKSTKLEEENMDATLSEGQGNSVMYPKQLLTHPALTIPLELNVSISNFIPIVSPDTSKWPLGLAFPVNASDDSATNPHFTLSLKCSVTLTSSPVPCVWLTPVSSQRCSVDMNTLFSLPITLKQLSPWLQVPLILEMYYQVDTSSSLLGLAKLPLGHLLETFLLSEQTWASMLPLSMQSECPVVDPLSGVVQGYLCVSLQFAQHTTMDTVDLPGPMPAPVEPCTDYVPLAIRVQGTGGFPGLARKVVSDTTSLPMLYKVQLDLFPDTLASLVSHTSVQTPWKRGLPQFQFQHTVQLRALEPMVVRYLEQGTASGQVLCASESTHVIGQFEVPLHLLLRRSSGVAGWVPVQSVQDDSFGCLQLEIVFKNTEKKTVASCTTEWVNIVLLLEELSEYTFTLDASVFGFLEASLVKNGTAYVWENGMEVHSESLVKMLNGHLLVHVHHLSSNFKGVCYLDTFDLAQTIRSGTPGRLHFRKEVVRTHDPETSSLYLSGYFQMEPNTSKPKYKSKSAHLPHHSNLQALRRHDSLGPSSFTSEVPSDDAASSIPPLSPPNSVLSPLPATCGQLLLCIQMIRFQNKEYDVSLPIQLKVPWDNNKVIHAASETSDPIQLTLSLPLMDVSMLHEKTLTIYLLQASFGQAQVQVDVSMLAKGWPKICGFYHLYRMYEQKMGTVLGQVLLDLSFVPPVSHFLHDVHLTVSPIKENLPTTSCTSIFPSSPPPKLPKVPSSPSHTIDTCPSSITSSPISRHTVSSSESVEEVPCPLTAKRPPSPVSEQPVAFVSVHGLRQRAAAIEREIQMTLRQYAFMESLDVS